MGALLSIVVAVVAIALGAAWVGGYLDVYQKKAQEKVLDAMGENKASYGLKSTAPESIKVEVVANAALGNLKTKLTGDKDLNELQDNVADGVGGLVGKGGPGEGVGSGLSEGL